MWRMQFHLWSTLHRLRSPSDLRTGEVLPDHFRNVSESLLLAARRYTPRPYAGSATLFRARDTPAFIQDPTLGWSELVEHLQIREVPGDHDTLLKEPHVAALALELKTCLEAARNAARDNLQTSNPS